MLGMHQRVQDVSSSTAALKHGSGKRKVMSSSLLPARNDEFYLRISMVGLLVAIAALAGFGTYSQTNALEQQGFHHDFTTNSKQFMTASLQEMKDKESALAFLTPMWTMLCPEAGMWPNCSFPMKTFYECGDQLSHIGDAQYVGLVPKVEPDKIDQFEEFASDFYTESGYPDYGHYPFGFGIYGINESTGQPYHSTTTPPNAKYDYLFPLFEVEPSNFILYNMYTNQELARTTDGLIDCTLDKLQLNDSSLSYLDIARKCASISNVVSLNPDPSEFNPALVLQYPVLAPRNASTPNVDLEFVGIIAMLFDINALLSETIPKSHLRIVLSNQLGQSWSYNCLNHEAIYIGEGDTHDEEFDSMALSFQLTNYVGGVHFYLTVYPTKDMKDGFTTSAPAINCVISVCVVILASILFLTYDFIMRKKVSDKEAAKRHFVRFVSHEMRTPLNTVGVGLTVLTEEMQRHMLVAEAGGSEHANDANVNVSVTMSFMREWTELISNIASASSAAVEVLNDLLNYDKIAMKTMNLDFEALNVWRLTKQTASLFEMTAKEKQIVLTLSTPFNDSSLEPYRVDMMKKLILLGDNLKIRTVIRNLISNSLKFTKACGCIAVSVEWNENGLPDVPLRPEYARENATKEVWRRSGSALIKVRDDGVGLNEEGLKSLFQEGWQFKANELQAGKGSGLGLYIAKGLIELHQGKMWAHSDGLNTGCTFFIELPLIANSDPDSFSSMTTGMPSKSHKESPATPVNKEKSKSPTNAAQQKVDGGSGVVAVGAEIKRILVVDDDAVCRKMVMRLLHNKGYECVGAEDGQQLVDMIAASTSSSKADIENQLRFDLVLVDFEMPTMNGPTATKTLRDLGHTLPIIGVTGNVMQKDTDHFLASGATAVISKPLSVNTLQKTITNLSRIAAT